jgi:hypothetical protein
VNPFTGNPKTAEAATVNFPVLPTISGEECRTDDAFDLTSCHLGDAITAAEAADFTTLVKLAKVVLGDKTGADFISTVPLLSTRFVEMTGASESDGTAAVAGSPAG